MLVYNARDLGTRMRDQRLELGLTQAVLAKRIGVARSWVIRVERGTGGADIGTVLRALATLGLDMDVRAAGIPAAPLADGGEGWTPDLAEILDRARRTEP